MVTHRRNNEAAERAAARRRREDDAPRLRAQAPDLVSLCLHIDEQRGNGTITVARHTRRVVVEHAPALFALPCADRDCRGGGHDLTSEIVHALAKRQTSFEGHHACEGQIGSSPCPNVLHYVAEATYR